MAALVAEKQAAIQQLKAQNSASVKSNNIDQRVSNEDVLLPNVRKVPLEDMALDARVKARGEHARVKPDAVPGTKMPKTRENADQVKDRLKAEIERIKQQRASHAERKAPEPNLESIKSALPDDRWKQQQQQQQQQEEAAIQAPAAAEKEAQRLLEQEKAEKQLQEQEKKLEDEALLKKKQAEDELQRKIEALRKQRALEAEAQALREVEAAAKEAQEKQQKLLEAQRQQEELSRRQQDEEIAKRLQEEALAKRQHSPEKAIPPPQHLALQGSEASIYGAKNDRQRAVVEAYKWAWTAYKRCAWGFDELKPISCSRL